MLYTLNLHDVTCKIYSIKKRKEKIKLREFGLMLCPLLLTKIYSHHTWR